MRKSCASIMNSYTKPKCSTLSTRMKRTRRARCSIVFITKDGRIRKSFGYTVPYCKIEFAIVFSFTSLFYSTPLKHQPPLFKYKSCSLSSALSVCLRNILLFSLCDILLLNHLHHLNKPYLFQTILAGRGFPSLRLLAHPRHFYFTTLDYFAIPP